MRRLTTFPADLGESPRWDRRRGWIWFVDLPRGTLYAIDTSGDVRHRATFPEELCSIALADDGSLALLLRGGLHRYIPETRGSTLVADAPYDRSTHLFNDCGVDPYRTLWVGIAAADEQPGAGALASWNPPHGFDIVRDGMTLPNGIDWSPSGDQQYVVDSLAHEVTVHAAGQLVGRWRLPDSFGLPDGLTVDADGGIWIAYWGGGCVRRHGPDGTVLDTHPVDTDLATAPLLLPKDAGRSGGLLVVTTARTDVPDDRLARQPDAGHVLVIDVAAHPAERTPFHWT